MEPLLAGACPYQQSNTEYLPYLVRMISPGALCISPNMCGGSTPPLSALAEVTDNVLSWGVYSPSDCHLACYCIGWNRGFESFSPGRSCNSLLRPGGGL